MTVFGHPVLFDRLEKSEDTASEKTPMQWHTTRTLSLDNALDDIELAESSWSLSTLRKPFFFNHFCSRDPQYSRHIAGRRSLPEVSVGGNVTANF